MKRAFSFVVFIICAAFIFELFFDTSFNQNININDLQHKNVDTKLNQSSNEKPTEMRACWFSYLEWQLLFKGKDENEFKNKAEEILNNLVDCGLNTLILQVRAFGDAFYNSKLSPTSKYLLNSVYDNISFDPLLIVTDLACKYHISVHAWINPLRTMSDDDFLKVPDKYIIKQWYTANNKCDYYIKDSTGKYILIAANPDVRKFISDIVYELIINYKIDGIHIDDYFYPSGIDELEESDILYYEKTSTNLDIKSWRRESTSALVKELYSKCHETNANIKFGVSPQANLKNDYDIMYIDVEQWLSNDGYVDYIMPQIYFGFENTYHPFDITVQEWSNLIKNNNTVLYAGLAVYKIGLDKDVNAGAGAEEWKNSKNILKKQEECLRQYEKYHGYCLYSYQHIYKQDGSKNPITQEEINNLNSLFSV